MSDAIAGSYAIPVEPPLEVADLHKGAETTIRDFYDKPDKYSEYEKTLDDESRIPYGKTIKQALKLLGDCKNPKVRHIADRIRRRNIVVAFDGLGENKGQLFYYDKWEKRSGEKGATYDVIRTAAIKVDVSYRRSAIAVAGVIAHEMEHIYDMEYEKNVEKTPETEKHLSGVIGNMDNPRAQLRAQTFAGYVLKELGFRKLKPDEVLSPEEADRLKQLWGSEWQKTASELYPKLSNIEDFENAITTKPPEERPAARRCGRLCKHSEYGTCDNRVYFPPCHLH